MWWVWSNETGVDIPLVFDASVTTRWGNIQVDGVLPDGARVWVQKQGLNEVYTFIYYPDEGGGADTMTLSTDQTAAGDKVFTGELRSSGNSALPWEGTLVANLQYVFDNYYARSQTGTAGEDIASGDVIYQDDNTYKWFKASASNLNHVVG